MVFLYVLNLVMGGLKFDFTRAIADFGSISGTGTRPRSKRVVSLTLTFFLRSPIAEGEIEVADNIEDKKTQ
ncbi:MAG: hypothetical protein WBB29_19525 [Geitlerinemataceae cyanobacterium]